MDEAVLGQAQGDTVEEMRAQCRKAELCERSGAWAGTGVGLAVGGGLAIGLAAELAAPTPWSILTRAVLPAALGGTIPVLVMRRMGFEAGHSVGKRHQHPGVRQVLERWCPEVVPDRTTGVPVPISVSRAPETLQDEFQQLVTSVQGKIQTLPEGPARADLTDWVRQDARVLATARGATLEEVAERCEQAERWSERGAWIGGAVGALPALGLVFGAATGQLGTLNLVSGLGLLAGLAIPPLVCASVGRDAAADLADSRVQSRSVQPTLERWKPLLNQERERHTRSEQDLPWAPTVAGEIEVSEDGVRVGGVLLPRRACA